MIPCIESKSMCAAKDDTLPLHTASSLPPMYWESHLYLVCLLHSSYSRLLLKNAKSKPCNKTPDFVTHPRLCQWQSVSSLLTTKHSWNGNRHLFPLLVWPHAHITLTPASKVLLSALSSTRIKGNHIGRITHLNSLFPRVEGATVLY